MTPRNIGHPVGLRALGLPARYVSGYIRTRPPPGRVARRGADQSHAWVGAWLGPAHGWIGLDPTNNVVVQDEHVVLGWGRDYGDVIPGGGKIDSLSVRFSTNHNPSWSGLTRPSPHARLQLVTASFAQPVPRR